MYGGYNIRRKWKNGRALPMSQWEIDFPRGRGQAGVRGRGQRGIAGGPGNAWGGGAAAAGEPPLSPVPARGGRGRARGRVAVPRQARAGRGGHRGNASRGTRGNAGPRGRLSGGGAAPVMPGPNDPQAWPHNHLRSWGARNAVVAGDMHGGYGARYNTDVWAMINNPGPWIGASLETILLRGVRRPGEPALKSLARARIGVGQFVREIDRLDRLFDGEAEILNTSRQGREPIENLPVFERGVVEDVRETRKEEITGKSRWGEEDGNSCCSVI